MCGSVVDIQSATAEIRRGKEKIEDRQKIELEHGPMPNVMAALPNVGGAVCSAPQSLADAHYYMACSNAVKTRYQLKFAGVSQNTGPISAASRPKFTILWGHL